MTAGTLTRFGRLAEPRGSTGKPGTGHDVDVRSSRQSLSRLPAGARAEASIRERERAR
jgi:hypothetical protein